MSMTTKCGKVVSEDRNKIIVRFDSIQEFIIFYANFIVVIYNVANHIIPKIYSVFSSLTSIIPVLMLTLTK